MFIGIRKEPNGSIYIDKKSYSKTEKLEMQVLEFENFKKQNPNTEYTFQTSHKTIKRQVEKINSNTPYTQPDFVEEEYVVDIILLTKRIFTDEELSQPPYNYTKVEIADIYSDCTNADFNEDFTFNVEKYNKRKERENALLILPDKLKRLEELRKDIVQDIAGLYIEDIEARKEEYRTLLNEVRVLQEKTPRKIKEI